MPEDTYRLYLLEKQGSGYISINHTTVKGSTTNSIGIIQDAARAAICKPLGLPSTVGIKLYVYQPEKRFGGNEAKPPKIRKELETIFNEGYRAKCLHFSMDDALGDIDFKEHIIVVFTFEFRFFLFNQLTYTYFDNCKVNKVIPELDKTIADEARRLIVDLTWPGADVRIVRIVEPTGSLLEEYELGKIQRKDHDCTVNADREKVTSHGNLAPLRDVNARDSLIVEFELQYFSIFFEKAGSSHKCLGSRPIPVSPNDTISTIIDQAKAHFPGSHLHGDFKVYELMGDRKSLRGAQPKDIEAQLLLDNDYLDENATRCIDQDPLRILTSNTLIVIFVGEDGEHRKRPPDSIEEEPDHDRKKIVEAARQRKSPSSDAKLSHTTQKSTRQDAVRNERPIHLAGPPIQIYHPVFAKFLSRAFLQFDGNEEILQWTSKFIQVSRDCYENDASRMSALRPCLADLVHGDAMIFSKVDLGDGKWFEPDATIRANYIQGRPQPVCAFVEVKNEVGTGGCDPALECQSDFVKLCSANSSQPIIDASCCPVFLLAIAGPRLLVAGAVFANTLIAQELTGYLNLGSHPTDPDRGVRRVAQVLVTLRDCIQDLSSFYNGLEFTEEDGTLTTEPRQTQRSRGSRQPSTDPAPHLIPKNPLNHVFPHHTEFVTDGKRFSFAYKRPLAGGEKATRALFIASMTSSPEEVKKYIVVKFTRSYCEEAHSLLAALSLAPKLLHHAEFAGIHFVVMERLEVAGDTSNLLRDKGEDGKKHVDSLREAVQALHDQKLVFGDLREPNILITKDGLKLVDFDWSGKEGTVRYPADIARRVEWPKGVKGGTEIKAEHDKVWFKRLTGTEL